MSAWDSGAPLIIVCIIFVCLSVQLTTHELRPGGTDEPVLEENKQEYIDLMVRWRLDRGVAEQMQSLLKGFIEVREREREREREISASFLSPLHTHTGDAPISPADV